MKPRKPKEDALTGFEMLPHRGGRSDGSLPRVTPIANGLVLAVYPDSETLAVMESEDWSTVKVGFKRNQNGAYEELALFKADDGVGVSIRHYKKQSVSIHVSVKTIGRAVAKPGKAACQVRREGNVFVFSIIDQISIEPRLPLPDRVSTEEDAPPEIKPI